MKEAKIKNLKTEILSDDWYILKKITFDYLASDGRWTTQSREAYDRGDGAAILLYNQKKKTVILTRQFRLPSYINGNPSGMLIEVCAGLLDGDDPEECIRKEAAEETGFSIKRPIKIFESYMSPGSVTEKLHFFISAYTEAMHTLEGGGNPNEHEDIEILEISFEAALEMIGNGEIKDAKTIMLLYHVRVMGIL